MSRIRERISGIATGGEIHDLKSGTTIFDTASPQKAEFMTDNPTGSPPWFDKAARNVKRQSIVSHLNGVDERYSKHRKTFGQLRTPFLNGYGTLGEVRFRSWAALKAEAFSSLNPSKPVVDLPLFLWELRELPRLLIQSGNILSGKGNLLTPSGAGDAYLAAQFGWAPLISDIKKLLDFSTAFDEQKKRIEKISKTKRKKGSLQGHSESWSGSSLTWTPTGSYTKVSGREEFSSTSRAWYVAKFRSYDTSGWPDSSNLDRIKAGLGLTPRWSTVWNAIPWSWLIDYFTNIGSLIEGLEARAQFDLESICIMQNGVCSSSIEDWSILHYRHEPPGESPPPPKGVVKAWERRVYFDESLGISFEPILNSRQMGILAALGASRSRFAR